MSHLAIFALGPLRIELDGQPMQTSRHKALALLVYLALCPGEQTREVLSALLWPEYEQERAFAYLRRTIWEINNLLGEGWLDSDREKIGLNPCADIFLDVVKFQAQIAAITNHNHPDAIVCPECVANLHNAALLYRGDFLAGFSLRDSAGFDDWQFFQQEAFRRIFARSLQELVNQLLLGGLFTEAISFAQRWLALDTLNEQAHRQLMIAFTCNGLRHSALRQYQECQRILKVELGIAPETATTALYEVIASGNYEMQDGNLQNPSTKKAQTTSEAVSVADWMRMRATRSVSNIPNPTTKFIGRQQELKQIAAQLSDPACWLLTLLGPGGIGKTRLAIEIGKNQTNEFPQGVFFIPLSTLEDRQSFAPAITRAMGLTLRQHGPTPEEQLLDFLREKRLLIILDSFEKMAQWASLLTEIHSNAFGVKMLITSRHRLHLQGEWVMEVKGLDFPPEQSKKASVEFDEDIKSYSAVDLFLQASHRALVTFQAQPEDIVAISRITQLLEGMPLGIELAATWVNTLSCQDITQEISRGLDILEASVVDLPERQRSLRAVFDYSWDLLSNREQVLLPRLAVFKGSFSRQAAEQVVGISLHELSCLVDKSLVRRTPQGWFDLHDLLHQYCAERLEQLPADDQETHRRHCAYFSARLWDWNRQLSSERQGEVMREIELELANIKAACDWAVYQKRLDFLEQIVDGLCTFLLRRGRFTEGLDTCLKTIKGIQGVTSVDDFARQARLSIRLLTWEAALNMNLERFEEAKQSIQESLRILDDPRLDPSQVISERIFTLIIQGLLANLGFDPIPLIEIYEEAFQLSRDTKTENPRLYIYFWRFLMGGGSVSKELYMQMEQNLAGAQQDGDPFELGCYLFVLGIAELYHYYRMENAEPLLRESVNKFQVVDDPTTQVMIFKTLGYLLSVQGEFEENLILKQSELEIYQDIGDRRMIGIAHVEIGEILYHQGDYAKAEEQIRTGLVIVKELSDYEYALRHRYLGDVLLVQGKYEEAQNAYQYSCQFFRSKNDKGWIFTALTGLSRTELALGDWQAAWDHAAQALQLYTEVQLYTFFAYLIVAEIALLLATRGEVAHALELYCLVLRQGYLAHSRWFADLFGKLIEEAAAQLPAEEYSEAKKRGEQLKFSDTIARLLNIMKDNDFERQ